jgi:hypothetical protein
MAQPTRCDGRAVRPRLSRTTYRRKTNGEESCQGRKEEGREEAVVLPQDFLRGARRAPQFFLNCRSPVSLATGRRSLSCGCGSEPTKRVLQHPGRRARRQSAPDRVEEHRAIRTMKGGNSDGEEGSEGRKEKGGEEAVASRPMEKGGGSAPFFYVRRVRFLLRTAHCGLPTV